LVKFTAVHEISLNLRRLKIETDPDQYLKAKFDNQCWSFFDKITISPWWGSVEGYKYVFAIEGLTLQELKGMQRPKRENILN
jgi:hypothetical protein